MTQDFFLTVEGVTDARTLNALISQISRSNDMLAVWRSSCIYTLRRTFNPLKRHDCKKISCKHYGIHSCLLERKGRNKDAEDIGRSFPRVTRESFIR